MLNMIQHYLLATTHGHPLSRELTYRSENSSFRNPMRRNDVTTSASDEINVKKTKAVKLNTEFSLGIRGQNPNCQVTQEFSAFSSHTINSSSGDCYSDDEGFTGYSAVSDSS